MGANNSFKMPIWWVVTSNILYLTSLAIGLYTAYGLMTPGTSEYLLNTSPLSVFPQFNFVEIRIMAALSLVVIGYLPGAILTLKYNSSK